MIMTTSISILWWRWSQFSNQKGLHQHIGVWQGESWMSGSDTPWPVWCISPATTAQLDDTFEHNFFYKIVHCKMHCRVKKLKGKTLWCNTEICIPPTCGPEGLAVLQSISIHRPPVRPTCRGHDSSSPFLLHSNHMHFSSTDKTSKVHTKNYHPAKYSRSTQCNI